MLTTLDKSAGDEHIVRIPVDGRDRMRMLSLLLIQRSAWFSVTPLPDDLWSVAVKPENSEWVRSALGGLGIIPTPPLPELVENDGPGSQKLYRWGETPSAGGSQSAGNEHGDKRDDETCKLCGGPYSESDGEGWDNLCPSCADRVSGLMDRAAIDRDEAISRLKS